MVGVFSEAEAKRPRHIKHFTIRAMNPEALAGFYIDVFGFKEEEKALEDAIFYLTDGTVTMVLAPYKISDYLGTEHKRRDSITSVLKSKICRASKMTSRYWRNTILNFSRRSQPMWNPSPRSSWICFVAVAIESTKCATRGKPGRISVV